MKKIIFIILILVFASLVSYFIGKTFFLADSPKLNPLAMQSLMAKINTIFITKNQIAEKSSVDNPLKASNSVTKTPVVKSKVALTNTLSDDIIKAINLPLKNVSQGVYADEVNGNQVFQIKTNEINYVEYTFNIKGKEVKIKVPKDQEKPSQELMERMY